MLGVINSFKDAPNGTVDIVLFGNSHMAWGVDPIIIEAKTGLKTEVIVGAGLEIAQVYYNLLKTLETQAPKYVVVETYPLIMRNSINDKIHSDFMLKVLGRKPLLHYNSFTYRNFAVERRGGDIYDKFYVFRYRDIWTDHKALIDNWGASLKDRTKTDLQHMQRSGYFIPEEQALDFQKKSFLSDDMFLNEQERYFVGKLIDLSKEKNFELIFFKVPVYDKYLQKTKPGFERINFELTELINPEKNVRYFDYNLQIKGLDHTYLRNEWGITHSQHLNYKGVITASNALSDEILDTTSLNKDLDGLFRSPELAAYNYAQFNERSMLGELTRIQFHRSLALKRTDTVAIPVNIRKIVLEGWMQEPKILSTTSEKIVALKKNSDFIYLARKEISENVLDTLKNQTDRDLSSNRYRCEIDRRYLEPGVYRIYHILKSDPGQLSIMDMKKWIQIE